LTGLSILTLTTVCAVACSEVGAPGTGQQRTPAAVGSAAPAAPAAAVAEPQTVADISPEGPQRAAVMNNCGSCHNLACAAIGQRSSERWDALKAGHKDKVSDADLNAMFEYLKANFDASRPEPKIPPRFLEGGCTPF
jgi:hypothetical protein